MEVTMDGKFLVIGDAVALECASEDHAQAMFPRLAAMCAANVVAVNVPGMDAEVEEDLSEFTQAPDDDDLTDPADEADAEEEVADAGPDTPSGDTQEEEADVDTGTEESTEGVGTEETDKPE